MKHTSKLLLFLVGSLMWVACHADCYVSPTGVDAANCTLASPCRTIAYCLNQTSSGDLTISLSPGNYFSENCGVRVEPPESAYTNLVIQGLTMNGTVSIDCSGQNFGFRFVNINATFTINSITLIGGDATSTNSLNGGCLYASQVQSLTVQNVAFQKCVGNSAGALYTDSPTSIMDSTFSGNIALGTTGILTGTGGAVSVNVANLNSSIFSMSKSVLSGNTAQYGGAISINGDYASITNCNITGNKAIMAGLGGGVYLTTTRPTYVGNYDFLGTIVSNNTATVYGGGLYSYNLNHTFNVFGALFANNTDGSTVSATADPNVYCSSNTSLFCYSCAASDCQTGCATGNNQSCSLNAAAQAFCYSTKFTTCVGNSCTCSAKSGLPTSAKIVIVLIAVCMLLGIFLIAIDVIRHFRQKKQGYTPIGS